MHPPRPASSRLSSPPASSDSSPHSSPGRAEWKVDLHAHSTCSDGALSPRALVELAFSVGVEVLALTDHDTVAGVANATIAATELGMELVAGVEVSAFARKEVHILGLFVDVSCTALLAQLHVLSTGRVDRLREIGRRLAAVGASIDVDAVLEAAGGANVGRPHLASALIAAGHVKTFQEAFDRFLGRDAPAYLPAGRYEATDAIALIHAAGGVAVLAHPGVNDMDDQIRGLVDAGLDGLEVMHPAHDGDARDRYLGFCKLYGLLISGGADFHSPSGPNLPGAFGISRKGLEALRERRSVLRWAGASKGS